MTAVRCADVDALVDLVELKADCTDLADLAELLSHIRDVKARLTAAELDVEGLLSQLVRSQQVTAGLWRLERKGGGNRKHWQSEQLLSELIARSNVTADGEPRPAAEARELLIETLRDCVPFTASLGWRAGGLRKWGLKPDEWSHWEPGRVRIEVSLVEPGQPISAVASRFLQPGEIEQ